MKPRPPACVAAASPGGFSCSRRAKAAGARTAFFPSALLLPLLLLLLQGLAPANADASASDRPSPQALRRAAPANDPGRARNLHGAFLHITDIHPVSVALLPLPTPADNVQNDFPPPTTPERTRRRPPVGARPLPPFGISYPVYKIIDRSARTNSTSQEVRYRLRATARSLAFNNNGTGEDGEFLQNFQHNEAGWWGAPGTSCDSPFSLVNATFAWAGRELGDKIDFIIWTGDNARCRVLTARGAHRHDSDRKNPRSEKEINALNRYIATMFRKTFAGNIPVVPSIGTFPSLCCRQGDQLHVFQRGGYFVRDVVPNKIAAISLNTMYFYNSNTAVNGCKGKRCPGKAHLAWLKVTLRLLRRRKMKVVISGHVSPATSNYYPRCLKKYTRIVSEFRDVIAAQVFGHNNLDHFFFLKEEYASSVGTTGVYERGEAERDENEDDEGEVDKDEAIDGEVDEDAEIKGEVDEEEDANGETGEEEDVDEDIDGDDEGDDGKNGRSDDEKANFVALDRTDSLIHPVSTRDNSQEAVVSVMSRSYVGELIKSFRKLPKRAGGAGDDAAYSVVHVTPSVIPVYNPSLRVFKYYTGGDPKCAQAAAVSPPAVAGARSRFGEITDYVQYYVDLAALYQRNGAAARPARFPGYEVEYVAREEYPLGGDGGGVGAAGSPRCAEPLGVPDWINLARRIAWDAQVQRKFMRYLYVSNLKVSE
ncbi:MAG: hypothetical protein BJ554DRAFT_840 [Olpidium bornovanus]|uniref:Endopolyphosphatase n=1 Tax=Olpidium bornovanus TaxID=278681 RepID=A0A8H8DHU6_9FUNG|nr:MAG: hypothetical protein BJ554DRAFT_840 [Olpidium bornovanus]